MLQAHGEALKPAMAQPFLHDMFQRIRRAIACLMCNPPRSDDPFHSLVERSSDAIARLDRDGRYVYVNPAHCALAGLEASRIIGRNCREIGAPEHAVELFQKNVQEVVRSGYESRFEIAIPHEGHTRWFEARFMPEHLADGTVGTVLSLMREITDRRQLEQQRTELERRQRALLDGIAERAWLKDLSGRYLAVNRQFASKTGHSPDHLIGKTVWDILPADVAAMIEMEDQEVVECGQPIAVERSSVLDHHVTWRETIKVPLRNSSDRIIGLICSSRDMTPHKRAQESLEESERRLQFALRAAKSGVWEWWPGAPEIYWSEEAYAVIGLDPAKARPTFENWLAQIHPEDRTRVLDRFEHCVRTKSEYRAEYRVISDDGTIRWISDVGCLYGKGTGHRVIGINTDITERKLLEKALQESNGMLHAIFGASPYAIIAFSTSLEVMFWNPAAEHLFGWKAGEVIGRVLPTSSHSDLEALGRGMLNHEMLANKEAVWQMRDGSPVEILLSGAALRDTVGKIAGTVAICVDVTERNREQRALMASEEQFRLLAEDAQAVFWIGDRLFSRIDYISPGFDEMWGMPRKDVFRDPKAWIRHIHVDDLPVVESFLRSQADGLPAAAEIRLSLPNGAERWIRARSFPHNSSRLGDCVTGIVSDITDVKVQAANRLAQVEQQRDALVREVHHRIKNHLQGVAGLLRMHESETRADKKILERAITQIQSVAIIHGLQGLKAGSEVILCEMVPAIVKMMQGFGDIKTELATDAKVEQPVRVTEAETVPVALILTEMISNAIKHNDPPDAPIRIAITTTLDSAKVQVINGGKLTGIPYSSAAGSTGLDLVKALMPPHGATFALDNTEAGVEARLLLHYPAVISIQSNESSVT